MQVSISPTLHIAILLITIVSQTGIDLLYTQSIFLQGIKYKRVVLGSINMLSALIIVMIIRLLYPMMADIFINFDGQDPVEEVTHIIWIWLIANHWK